MQHRDIGELIKSITNDTRKEHMHIPWKAIAGLRYIAAHKYQTLRAKDVYNTVCIDFPFLKKAIGRINEEHPTTKINGKIYAPFTAFTDSLSTISAPNS